MEVAPKFEDLIESLTEEQKYLIHNAALSVMGTDAAITALRNYIDKMENHSQKMIHKEHVLDSIDEIRNSSYDMLCKMELLRASIDRFLYSEDDINGITNSQKYEIKPTLTTKIKKFFGKLIGRTNQETIPNSPRFRDTEDVKRLQLKPKSQHDIIDDHECDEC